MVAIRIADPLDTMATPKPTTTVTRVRRVRGMLSWLTVEHTAYPSLVIGDVSLSIRWLRTPEEVSGCDPRAAVTILVTRLYGRQSTHRTSFVQVSTDLLLELARTSSVPIAVIKIAKLTTKLVEHLFTLAGKGWKADGNSGWTRTRRTCSRRGERRTSRFIGGQPGAYRLGGGDTTLRHSDARPLWQNKPHSLLGLLNGRPLGRETKRVVSVGALGALACFDLCSAPIGIRRTVLVLQHLTIRRLGPTDLRCRREGCGGAGAPTQALWTGGSPTRRGGAATDHNLPRTRNVRG
jgi:hypothetical protein